MRRLVMGVRPPGDELRVLDVGTGSGAIAISIAADLRRRRVHPDEVVLLAVDISPDALDLARENAVGHGIGDRVRFAAADLIPPGEDRAWEIVVANLPYVRADAMASLPVATTFEPALALDGGADGLEVIGRLLDLLPRVLADGGIAYLEIGADQGEIDRRAGGGAAPGLGLPRRAGPGGAAAGRGRRAGSRMSLQDATRAAAIRGTEPGFPVRLVALDIDGTLVGDDLTRRAAHDRRGPRGEGAWRGGLAGHRAHGVERHAVRARARADRPDHRLPGRADPGHAGARVGPAREAAGAHAAAARDGARGRGVDPRARARPPPQPPRAVHPPRRRPARRRLLGVHGRAGRAGAGPARVDRPPDHQDPRGRRAAAPDRAGAGRRRGLRRASRT